MIERCSEKIGKRLIGNTEIDDALSMLDKLAHEEGWMGTAQTLMATQAMGERVAEMSHGA